MTDPRSAALSQLAGEFDSLANQLAHNSRRLRDLEQLFRESQHGEPLRSLPMPPRPVWPQYRPSPPFVPATPPQFMPPAPPPAFRPITPPPPREPRRRPEGWVGKLLAVAGVAVTLVGVVLLLVLAAQAGILRPEFRVTAGAVLAAGLVGAGTWWHRRAEGRVGAVALTATGIAAAYIDLIAVTTVYGWLPPAPALVAGAAIAGGGLLLARRWDSEHLGLLVFVPLLVLAPVVTDGVTLLLIGFLLALAAASLPVQLGRDWVWLHTARTFAATLPLLAALLGRFGDPHEDLLLAGACALGTALAVVAALVLLPGTIRPAAVALLTAVGVTPVLGISLTVDHVIAALAVATLSAVLLAIVLAADRLPGIAGAARSVFAALSAVAALVAISVAVEGRVAGPVLLAMAVVVAVAARRTGPGDGVGRWAALGFAVVGLAAHLVYASPADLAQPHPIGTAGAVSTMVSSALLIVAAVVLARLWRPAGRGVVVGAGVAVVGAVTTAAVTAGLLVGGGSVGGFYAGHMVATICWMGMAAALFARAARLDRAQRSGPISGGLCLVAAAVSKLFLFDLGTLDGIFRAGAFLITGLVLLGMGSGYARFLDHQDRQDVTTIMR